MLSVLVVVEVEMLLLLLNDDYTPMEFVVHILERFFGLDEKAMEAVRKWRFKPGYKDGKPVSVLANVEVNFRLL